MARNQNKAVNGVVGCFLLLVLLVVGVNFLPDFIKRWNSEPFTIPTSTPRPDAFTSVPSARVVTTATRTNTPAPSPTFGWTKVPYDYSSATTEGRADLRTCPELICDVVVSVDAGHLLRIAHLVLGGRVDGNGDWFEVNHDGQLLYVPVVEVFTDTVTRMALTASVIDVDDEMVAMPVDVVFYQCPQLDCVEAGTIPQGQRMLITRMVAGEMVGGIVLWVVAVDRDGDEAYAPMVYVFPPTPTETMTAQSETSELDVMEYNATLYTVSNAIVRGCPSTDCQNLGRVDVGQAVTVTGMVDGEIVEVGYAIWYRVEYDGAVGYIYQTLLTIDAPAPVATPAPSTNSNTSSSAVCPRNCSTAVAMGWTDVQAGQCDNLDRDGDKVACYGD